MLHLLRADGLFLFLFWEAKWLGAFKGHGFGTTGGEALGEEQVLRSRLSLFTACVA